MAKYTEIEQMEHEKAKGQQAEKLFLGSLRASRAIKNYFDISTRPYSTKFFDISAYWKGVTDRLWRTGCHPRFMLS